MIGLLSIIAVGFVLGMRHATDPDHVIAISSTIRLVCVSLVQPNLAYVINI